MRIGRLPAVMASSLGLLMRAAPALTAVLVLLQILNAVGQAALLTLLGRIVGRLVVPDASAASLSLPGLVSRLSTELGVLAGVLVLTQATQLLQANLRLLLTQRVTWYTFERLLDVAVEADPAEFDRPEFHNRMERAKGASTRPTQISNSLLALIGSVSSVVSLSAVLLAVFPPLVPLLFLAVIPLLWANAASSRRAYQLTVTLSEHEHRRVYLRGLLMSRRSAVEVQAYGLAGYLRELSQRLFVQRYTALKHLAVRALPGQLFGALAAGAVLTAGIGTVAALALRGSISPAAAGSAVFVVMQLGGALGGMGLTVSQLYDSAVFLEDYRAFRALLPGLERRRSALRPAPRDFTTIYVDNVTFTYPAADRPAISEVSMRLNRGEIVALVGENGSGKTTLAKLVCNLYSPQQGCVWWDYCDLATVDPEEIRESIAVLMQDFGRYLFSVADNIGVGRVNQIDDREAIMMAAAQARADQFIADLPQGYDTVLGTIFSGSTDISGGQWQRIALARAFFRAAPLVVLDEPTASLDARAEHELYEGMRELFVGRTVLLITHRLLSVRSADRIYVLDSGQVVEAGTHEHLMRLGGRYAQMYQLQAANRDDVLNPHMGAESQQGDGPLPPWAR